MSSVIGLDKESRPPGSIVVLKNQQSQRLVNKLGEETLDVQTQTGKESGKEWNEKICSP